MTLSRGGSATPAPVRALQDRFERWRKNKSGRERIPEQLWAAAVKLCARHGVERVRRGLRLNYTALRDRIAHARRSGPVPQKKKSAPAFVEWVSTAPPSPSLGAEYLLELDDLQVRVRGAGVEDVAALAKLLRRQEP
jgi:hypothetical protein